MSVSIEQRDGWTVKIHNDQLEMWEWTFGEDGDTAVVACWNRPTATGTIDVMDGCASPGSATTFAGINTGITDRQLWEQIRDMAADIASRTPLD